MAVWSSAHRCPARWSLSPSRFDLVDLAHTKHALAGKESKARARLGRSEKTAENTAMCAAPGGIEPRKPCQRSETRDSSGLETQTAGPDGANPDFASFL